MKNLSLIGALLTIASCLSAGAQVPSDGAGGGVTGMGTATIKRLPDRMRMQVALTAEGKTLKDALAKLEQRREAAKAKLAKLAPAEGSVVADDPHLSVLDPRQQQMAAMMRARRGGAAAKPATPAAAPPVKVAMTLKAEWALAAKTAEELLVASHELQAKIKAADLADTKQASAEEQEAREEAAGQDPDEMNMNNGAGGAPGDPGFVFVSKIDDAERAKAMAEAFGKAKANAAELAKAASAQLGALKNVTSNNMPDMEQYQYMQYQRYNGGMNPAMNADEGEAIGAQATAVTMKVAVSASFGLK